MAGRRIKVQLRHVRTSKSGMAVQLPVTAPLPSTLQYYNGALHLHVDGLLLARSCHQRRCGCTCSIFPRSRWAAPCPSRCVSAANYHVLFHQIEKVCICTCLFLALLILRLSLFKSDIRPTRRRISRRVSLTRTILTSSLSSAWISAVRQV